MNLDELRDFALVATHGGFAPASRASGRPKATLSRTVMALEARLGVRLLERGSRAVRLTDEGAALYARTAGPLRDIAEAAADVREGGGHPRGRLRVHVPVLFGQLLMGRLAARFTAAHPQVRLEVTTEDRAVDPVRDGYDAIIRVNPAPDSGLVGRCFVRDRLLVVAAPAMPPPSTARADARVPVVVRRGARPVDAWWIAGTPDREVRIRPVLALPTLMMIRDAVLTGLGAAQLPRLLVADDLAAGRLVAWGPAPGPPVEVWVLHASRRHASARVRAFSQFLRDAFPGRWL